MKKKLSRIAAILLAVVMVVTAVSLMPTTDAKAADTPSFTVKTDVTEMHPGDTVHVEFWLNAGADVMQVVGGLDFDTDVYTYVADSLQLNDQLVLDAVRNNGQFIVEQSDVYTAGGFSFLYYSTTRPINGDIMFFAFDVTVNEDATGSGLLGFNCVGCETGTSDTDRVEVEPSDIVSTTVDANGNAISASEIPVVIELQDLIIDQNDFTMVKGTIDTLTVTATPEAALAGKTVTWSSSDESVVTVDQNGNIEAVGNGAATITATVDEHSDSVSITVNSPLTSITLDTQETSVKKGDTVDLDVIFTPEDTTDDTTVVWSSSDESVATVDGDGVVTAHKDGTATITATVGTLTTECIVHVREVPLTGIDLDRTAITMNKGETSEALKVSYNPEDTTDDRTVTWTTSDESVAVVDDGIITAVGAGTATITATVGEFTATCEVTVLAPLESLSIRADRTTDNLEVGDTVNMTVEYAPEDTTDDKAVIWSSSDETVVTVNEAGVVTAVAGGTATITATSAVNAEITASYDVKVLKHTTGITLGEESLLLRKNQISEPVEVTFDPEDTDDSQEITWTTSDEMIATVNDEGIITGVSEGTTTITATAKAGNGTVSDSVEVTVYEIHIEDAELAVDTPSELYIGQLYTIEVITTPDYVTDEVSYTYTSSDETVATVDEEGTVNALTAGTTDITVTVSAENFTKELTFSLEVSEIPLESIAFRQEITPLEEGQTAQLEILFNPENTTVDKTVTWASSDMSIANVSEDGLITAVKAGTTVISASVGDKEVSYGLTVTEKKEAAEPETPTTDKPSQGNDDATADGSGNAGDKVNNQTVGGAVQTGDTTNIFGIMLTMLVSLSVVALVIVFRSKGKKIHK